MHRGAHAGVPHGPSQGRVSTPPLLDCLVPQGGVIECAVLQKRPAPRRVTSLRSPRLLLVLAAVLVVLALAPSLAQAHGVVVKSEPTAFVVLDRPPTRVVVWANEPVSRLSSLRVFDPTGQRVEAGATRVDPTDPRRVEVGLRPLTDGKYTVRWTLNSRLDGHTTQGTFQFSVAQSSVTRPDTGFTPDESPTPAPLAGATWSAAQVVQTTAHWLVLLAALALVGGLLFRLAVPRLLRGGARAAWDRGLAQAAAQRWSRVERLLLALLAAGTVVSTLAVAANAGQGWSRAFSPSFMWDFLSSTAFGVATIVKIVLSLVLLATVPWPEQTRRWALVLGGLAYLALVSYSGHAAGVQGAVPVSVAVDWLHLLAASAWVGSMGFVGLALLPTGGEWKRQAGAWQQLVQVLSGFSPIAWASVALLVVTGAYNSITRLSGLSEVMSTGFGRVLIAKLVLVAVMLAFSALNVFRARPRLAADLKAKPQKPPTSAGALRRLLRWEPIVGVAVIATTALLATYPPPGLGRGAPPNVEGSVEEAPRFSLVQRASDLLVTLRLGPGELGVNSFELELGQAADGVPLPSPATVDVRVTSIDQGQAGEAVPVATELLPDGHYGGEADFAIQAIWKLEATIKRQGQPDATTTYSFPIPVVPGEALLSRAQQAMNSLSSLRMRDTLDNGAGLVITANTDYQAPGRMHLRTSEGREIYILGEMRYLREPGQRWQVGQGPPGQPFKWPDYNFREGFIQPVIVGAERIDVQPHSILAAYDSKSQLYYLMWIGTDDNLVRRWLHTGPGHFLESTLLDFNSKTINITAPNTAEP